MISKGKKNQIYNIGNDSEPIQIINLAKKMVQSSKKRIKILKVPFVKSDRSFDREIFTRQPNIKKSSNILIIYHQFLYLKEFFLC